jgi:hypothetical protein
MFSFLSALLSLGTYDKPAVITYAASKDNAAQVNLASILTNAGRCYSQRKLKSYLLLANKSRNFFQGKP